MLSKSEIIGEEILKRIHVHDYDSGGVFTLTTGAQGSAKTSTLLSFTDYAIKFHPKEKIFWSECYKAPLQIFKLNNKKYHFYIQEDKHLIFRDRNKKNKHINIPYTTFSTYDELYEIAEPGIANVVFFGNKLYWMDYIEYLLEIGEWTHVFIDEISEICPAYQNGALWRRIKNFSNNKLKDVRKCMVNLHGNTQQPPNIDDSVRKQVMIDIFLSGARPGKHNRVTQKAIDNLERNPILGNQAYLEYSGRFGLTRFKDIYKPSPKYHIDVVPNGGGEVSYSIPSFQNV